MSECADPNFTENCSCENPTPYHYDELHGRSGKFCADCGGEITR